MEINQNKSHSGTGRNKVSLYDEVTSRIIAELEQGCVPWVQPWGRANVALGLPRNAATQRHYAGLRVLDSSAGTIAS